MRADREAHSQRAKNRRIFRSLQDNGEPSKNSHETDAQVAQIRITRDNDSDLLLFDELKHNEKKREDALFKKKTKTPAPRQNANDGGRLFGGNSMGSLSEEQRKNTGYEAGGDLELVQQDLQMENQELLQEYRTAVDQVSSLSLSLCLHLSLSLSLSLCRGYPSFIRASMAISVRLYIYI